MNETQHDNDAPLRVAPQKTAHSSPDQYDMCIDGEHVTCPKDVLVFPGLVVVIPKNKKVTVRSRNCSSLCFLVDEGAALTLFYQGEGKDGTLTIIGKEKTEIIVQHIFQTTTSLKETIELGHHAFLKRQCVILGDGDVTVNASLILAGEDASIDDKELFFVDKQQRYAINTQVYHKAPRTSSTILIKGLAKDTGYCNAKGMVRIEKHAGKTTSHLAEHVLLLNKGARANALPNMEIEAQDVRAGHSASVSHMDEQQLFYAMTRGIPYDEARKMIALGFLAPVAEGVEELVAQKWGDGLC